MYPSLADTRDMAEIKDWNMALLSLDQKKAFDQTSHRYLHKILFYYGFGEDFRNWIKLIYKDISSLVYLNGYMGTRFSIQRSNRQGDPISFPLFTLCEEPFLCLIRKKSKQYKDVNTR